MSKGRVKNVPTWRPHYDVLRTPRERQFNALYKIYYYNIFEIVSVYQEEAKTTELIQCLINFGRRPKDVLIAS